MLKKFAFLILRYFSSLCSFIEIGIWNLPLFVCWTFNWQPLYIYKSVNNYFISFICMCIKNVIPPKTSPREIRFKQDTAWYFRRKKGVNFLLANAANKKLKRFDKIKSRSIFKDVRSFFFVSTYAGRIINDESARLIANERRRRNGEEQSVRAAYIR